MKSFIHASLVYLLILWGVFHGSCEDERSSSLCDLVLTTVRTEASPDVLHELCFDNNSLTFVVKCDKIWYEQILDFCSTVGLHTWNISMDRLSISSPLTLQLVKSGKVVDACSLKLTTEHLVHETISVLGYQKTRFVLTIEKDCSLFPDNGAREPGQYNPETFSNEITLNPSTTSVKPQHLSQSEFKRPRGKRLISTTTENARGINRLMNSSTKEDPVQSLQPMQTTNNMETTSPNILKCKEDAARCSKSLDLSLENKTLRSDYTSQSSYTIDYPDTVDGGFKHNKQSSGKQNEVEEYFSSIFQAKKSEIQPTSVNVYTSLDTLLSSNYAVHQYKHLNTLTITPTVYPKIVPYHVTNSDNKILKSDVLNIHFHLSSIVSESLIQHSNEIYGKHDADKTDKPTHRRKRDSDNKLGKMEPFSSNLQSSSYPDNQFNLPAKVIDATLDESLETLKHETSSSHMAFENTVADNIIYNLVNMETSDSVLSVHSEHLYTMENGVNTLQVSTTDITLFPTMYSPHVNFDVNEVSADLSNTILSEYRFHEEHEMQSSSIMPNSIYLHLYNSTVHMETENRDLALDTAVLRASETLWTDSSSGLGTSIFSDSQDDQAHRAEPTYVISLQSFSMAENDAESSTVLSTQRFEPQAPSRVSSYLFESSGYEQVSHGILSALSSTFSNEIENEYSYETSAAELVIENSENTDPYFASSSSHTSSHFTLSISPEINIHSDPLFIESTVLQFATSYNDNIFKLISSSEFESIDSTDQISLQPTAPLLIEENTPMDGLITSPLIDFMTTPLIQLTKSSSWNFNNDHLTVEYSNIDHHTVSPIYGISITPQKSEVNPSLEYTGVTLLTSNPIVPSLILSDSRSIASSTTRHSSFDTSHTSNESILVSSTFTQVIVPSSAVTEPKQTSQTTGASTPSRNSSTIVTPQARHDDSAGIDDDKVWPVVAALVIGIPVAIVLGIAVTVIHRNRRQDPSKFFAMRTLNSSSQSSIATPRQEMSRESSIDV